jgi:Secretion system C-terminal sorting domain
MNARKILFIVMIAFLGINFCFAQAKDEALYGQTDPVKSVQVFPNPATEFLTIKFETPIAKKTKFTVHNIIGNELEIDPELIDEYEVHIKVKDLHEGYYFLAIQSASSKSTFKFLKR